MRPVVAAALALAPVLAHAAVDDQGPRPRLAAVRAEAAPRIDGRFDDAVWRAAPANEGPFIQTFPNAGKPATERTDVRVAYDDANLYVAVRCFDGDPRHVSARLTRRDRDIETDWLALYIDSRHDHSSAYIFQLSAAGVQVDGEIVNDNSYTGDWDAVWNGAVTRDPGGWNAEFAIPLTVLRFSDAPEQVWGFNVHRNISRKREQSMWTFIPQESQALVSRFGHIDGIRGVHRHRTFELRPYAVARARSTTDEGGALFGTSLGGRGDATAEVGLDLKLGITSRLTLDATVNPDFGQVEADQVVLNLTRFETFFPEKRPFFLEGREQFETPLTLVYSRRIGRPAVGLGRGATVDDGAGGTREVTDADGSLPIWAAGKIAGTLGPLSIGAMGALTGAEVVETRGAVDDTRDVELAGERFYGALRAKWSPAANTFVGAMTTMVNRLGGTVYRASANHDAYTQGLDARWSSGDRWRVTAQLVASQRVGGTTYATANNRPCPAGEADPDCLPVARQNGVRMEPGATGFGAYGQLNYSSEHAFVNASVQSLSPKLDLNDMGFLPQFDEHRVYANAAYAQRRPRGPFQQLFIIPFTEHALSWEDGVLQTSVVGLDSEFLFKGFIFTSPQITLRLPGSHDDYETFDGAHFERPTNLDLNWVVNSNPANRLWGQIRGYYRKDLEGDGRYIGAVGEVRWQILDNLELSVAPEIGFERALRFTDCSATSGRSCLVDTGPRLYRFADLDSRFVSTVVRATYTFVPTLSLQAYGQLFMARGSFERPVEQAADGVRPFLDRADFLPSAMPPPDGFEEVSLNLNIVLRWEPVPGSTLFGVFTRAQEAPHFNPAKLNRGPNEDVFLLKLVYYVS